MEDCKSAKAILVCKVPLKGQAGSEWPRRKWVEVDKVHERVTFHALAWLLERIKNVNERSLWTTIDLSIQDSHVCERCSPTAPAIRWTRNDKGKIHAIEDASQAGAFERALKNRPAPFVTQLKLDEDTSVGTVRIGVNIASLIHRAFSRLPKHGRTELPQFAWKFDTNFTDPAKLNLPKFILRSNKKDPEIEQPKHFKIPLRKEQLRSLGWMLKQESQEAEPFVEEEIAEAILTHLNWRVEGRAQRPVNIRGGVLADEVGYGKTAITLGLIDSAKISMKQETQNEKVPGKIYVRGTLIVVPPHLTRQWGSEIKKFTGDHFIVEIISTASNLNSLTIQDVMDADIIVVASNLFHSGVYLSNLEAFSAGGTLPNQDGRYFNARLEQILSSLRDQVERLRSEGSEAANRAIHEARKRGGFDLDIFSLHDFIFLTNMFFISDVETDIFVQKKRLKGAKAREAAEAEKPKAVNEEAMEIDTVATKNYPLPSKKIVEVVIPIRRKHKGAPRTASSPSSGAEETAPATSDAIESSDAEFSKPSLRRRFNRVSLLESDSDEEDAPKVKKGSSSAKASSKKILFKKPVKRKAEESEYENSSVEEVSDDNVTADESEEDSEGSSVKKSAKKAPQPSRPTKRARKSAPTSDVEMQDEEPAPSKKSAKAKAKPAAEKKPAKPQKLREETDPWKLKSAAKSNWKQMHAPPLEMFHFTRLVIDEYTYLDGKILSLVQKLTATRRWVLSGTPPIHDFAALKTISAFLDIHLGIDDDGEGSSAQVKKRRREQTGKYFLVAPSGLSE